MSFAPQAGHVRVRMYNVGFGDAFLLAFPGRERGGRMLIDCGSHSGSKRPRPVADVVKNIVETVTDDDGVPRIDLVIGTHRHQDHVSGFGQALWKEVEVGEVWMPWTEHPTDEEAKRIRETQSKVARRLHASLQLLGAESGLIELAENALTNHKAMTTLHRGFRGNPPRRFLSGPARTPRRPRALEGVDVHVLGPSRDPEIIRDMNPPIGESYFRFGASAAEDGNGTEAPFTTESWLAADELAELGLADLRMDKHDLKRLSEIGGPDAFGLAVALEDAVNGTSLMLAFEVGDAVLLFPGDAQWGTWRRAIDDETAKELLARTTFYKVGHHGSHNATPKDFVEDVLGSRREAEEELTELLSMVSTHPMPRWKSIPKQELLEALKELPAKLVRSDETDAAVPDFVYESDLFIETHVPV
jgi:beta-lactamase superfamily II metal-dependent hydrolase